MSILRFISGFGEKLLIVSEHRSKFPFELFERVGQTDSFCGHQVVPTQHHSLCECLGSCG